MPRSPVAQIAEHNYSKKTSWLGNQAALIDETGKGAKKLIDESWYINKKSRSEAIQKPRLRARIHQKKKKKKKSLNA